MCDQKEEKSGSRYDLAGGSRVARRPVVAVLGLLLDAGASQRAIAPLFSLARRTSENSVNTKFAEFYFHALG